MHHLMKEPMTGRIILEAFKASLFEEYHLLFDKDLIFLARICAAVKEIYTAQDRQEAETRMKKVINRYEGKCQKFCDCLEGLTFFEFPKAHWQKIRTSNVVERINRAQKRRTRVSGLFPSISSCERLVGAIAMQIHEEWAVNGKYLTKN